MNNFWDHDVAIGPTSDDEMCNFYLLYWVSGRDLPEKRLCWSAGPPLYSWDGSRDPEDDAGTLGAGFHNVPDNLA